jgi:predicted DNA-binding ribbon-helix-helix protein
MASGSSRRPPRPREFNSASLTIRNVVVAGHRTSVRLEPVMWEALRDIARRRDMPLNHLVTEIARRRTAPSLTAAIRVYIVDFYRSAAGIARAEPVRTPLPMERGRSAAHPDIPAWRMALRISALRCVGEKRP